MSTSRRSSSSSSLTSISYFLLFVLCIIPLLSIRWRTSVKSAVPFALPGHRVGNSPPSLGISLPSFFRIGGSSSRISSRKKDAKRKPPVSSIVTKVIAAVRRPATSTSPSSTTTSSPLRSVYGKLPLSSGWFGPPAKDFGRKTSPAIGSTNGGGIVSPSSLPLTFLPSSFVQPRVIPSSVALNLKEDVVSMTGFLGTEGSNVDVELVVLMTHIQAACKHIAAVLASPTELQASFLDSSSARAADRDAPKSLDVVARDHSSMEMYLSQVFDMAHTFAGRQNGIMRAALQSSGKVAAIASEEEDEAIWFGDAPFVVVFDPLDGSCNIDASIPTGTIFGIYRRLPEADHLPVWEKAGVNVMQRGERLVGAGYALYSSATTMCISVGSGLYGFTLDYSIGEFVYSHHDIRIPERGLVYSVNDARYYSWPSGLRQYTDNIRQGKGQAQRKYSAGYIGSLVADIHRTVLYGGIAMNPRSHLQLVYEANPLSYLVEQGGGKGTDGKRRILEINPIKLHQRLPLFLGSMADIAELISYRNIQQLQNPGYEV